MAICVELLVIILMLCVNGIFVAYEMALASVARARLFVLVGRKIKGAEDALFMKDNIEASFAIVQLGITLSTSIAAATGGLSASDQLSPWLVHHFHLSAVMGDVMAVILWVVPLSSVTIVFSELLPKLVALNNRERICIGFSPAMKRLYGFLTPIVRIFERTVKWIMARFFRGGMMSPEDAQSLHELQAAAAMARTSRLIGAHQEKIVVAAAQLSTRPVREIVIPIDDVSTIPVTSSLSQALVLAHMDMHTRFPVCTTAGDPQSIEGYVNFKDIIAALHLNPSDPSIKGIVRPVKIVEGDKPISQALEVMIQEKLHIILVAGKNGRLIGLVTLEDIIEELVGEIEDEFDRAPAYSHPFAGGWIMGGGVTMATIAQLSGVPFQGDPQEKLADWCLRHSPGKPTGGEEIVAEGLRVTPRKFRRHKLSEAAVAVAQ
ncbi:MAG: HlyC/CorC family transporter [Candidatus Omnitrophica bacterium]|nr:HlyC/CorC family transporter [Candidatus Omnitrophota bacterium]